MEFDLNVHERTLTRTEVRGVSCPECGARPGERCRGAKGRLREANHRGRWHLAYDTIAPLRSDRDGPEGAWL